MSPLRRKLLQAAGIAAVGLSGYTLHRGLRLPTLHWNPYPPNDRVDLAEVGHLQLTSLIITSNTPQYDVTLRAYAPEPEFVLSLNKATTLTICINNLAPEATLEVHSLQVKVDEQITGIRRVLQIEAKQAGDIRLSWELPKQDSYSFAVIGDTGGDQELAWCLQRAHQLGAKFMLHLGDFNYQPGDYQRAIQLFNNSPLPVYISIGNHDFHDGGAIYQPFLKEIGPLNHAFSIGKTRFVNIDTATSIVPYSAGQRGTLLKQLGEQSGFNDTVAFTHRPLHDPLEGSDHDIGNKGERDWLIAALKKINAPTLLSGHIHIFDRTYFAGIDNIIAGQGLGHQDLIVNQDYSWMVLGQVDSDGKVNYDKAPLAMPMDLHCHPRTDPVKQSLTRSPHWSVIEEINRACDSRKR